MHPISAISIGAVLLVGACGVTQVAAQEGRYTMERTENGYVRLDTRTGAVSLCRQKGEQIVCRMAADDRGVFEEQIDALTDRVAALEAAIEGDGPSRSSDLPSEEELDRTMGIMETFVRRFFGIIQELDRELGGDAPADAVPNRT